MGPATNGWTFMGYGVWVRTVNDGMMEAVRGYYDGPPEDPRDDE